MTPMANNQTDHPVNIVRATSTFDCGGRCPLKLHVKNNEILRVEGDDVNEPDQLRTCLRCRAYRKYVHHPERLKYPLRRTGEKGKGKFERISWDEAYDTIKKKIEHTIETYGNSGIFLMGVLWEPLGFFISPIGMAISRKFEREADLYCLGIMEGSEPLIRALKRMAKENLSNLRPHFLYVWFNYSHPPLIERIKRLEASDTQRP